MSSYLENISENSKVYHCEKCDLSFKSKSGFYYHDLTLHQTLNVKSQENEEDTTKNSDLSEKSKINNIDWKEARNFISNIAFDANKDLKDCDNLAPSNKRDYRCEICNKILTSNFNLNKHIQTIHNYSKKFKCSLCEKEYNPGNV